MPSLIPRDRPVARRVLREWVEPADIHAALDTGGAARFWLDSGIHAERGMSYLGEADRLVTSAGDGEVEWHPSGVVERMTLLEVLGRELIDPAAALLGWIGWIGYGLGAETTGLPIARDTRRPEAAMLRVDRLIAVDHASHTVELLSAHSDGHPEALAWFDLVEARIEGVVARRSSASEVSATRSPPPRRPARWRDAGARYDEEIRRCLEAIVDGEAYQLCLTTEVTVEGRIDPVDTWATLRQRSPSHHGGIIELRSSPRLPALALLSVSPETFLEMEPDGTVRSKPIKGTRPRSPDAARDAEFAAELLTDEKELAENLMIVDLMRNDLGRVCALGSVSVPSLFEVQTYAHVHQLVSTVEGTLAAGVHPVDAIASCFPAGSMTGAPKRSAMRILDGLEGRARGIYSGAFGYLGVDGSVDLAMIIRSIVVDDRGASIGSGGGITALSDPGLERAEVALKAAALLDVLGVGDQHDRVDDV
ncbi:MAG: hypothetical protein RI885_1750 [Actinomycetota bacterium]